MFYSDSERDAKNFISDIDYFCIELDFGRKAPEKVSVRVMAPADSRLAITIGETVAVNIPALPEWAEVSLPMPFKVKGMQNLEVELVSGTEVEVDWITFR